MEVVMRSKWIKRILIFASIFVIAILSYVYVDRDLKGLLCGIIVAISLSLAFVPIKHNNKSNKQE
jgi:energy-converting hydrogenase Eha subunit C